jgi:large subunit ribosomal protein L13
MKTFQPKKGDIKREWHLVDANGEVLGRMGSEIAKLLMGKGKTKYAPHLDMGDYVVVINAKDVELTGRKKENKVYYRHSGYPGGFKEEKFSDLIEKHPEKVIERAVSGMLPKNRLHDKRMRRLKVFADKNHKYEDKFKGK